MTTDKDDLVTAAAIARRAGVGRAAVSNWRKRYPSEFPRPHDGLYSWTEVLGWLTTTGKAGQLAVAGRTDTGTQRIDAVAPDVIGGHRVVPQERAIGAWTAEDLLARTMAALLPFPEDVGSPESGDEPDAGDPPVVLDPDCADGGLLAAVADRFGDHVQLVGHETDEAIARSAAARLRSHPLAARYAVHTGDPEADNRLAPYSGTAAAVLCRGPASGRRAPLFDPRWSLGGSADVDHELAWVTVCLSLLRPGGTAVVAVTPANSARPSGRELRSGLVRSGALREVIALPATLVGSGGSMVHLWVLRRPPVDAAPVRMIDLSDLADPADLPADGRQWERLSSDAAPTTVRAVPRLALLDGDTDLLPAGHLAARPFAPPGELAGIVDRIRTCHERIGDAFPEPVETPARRDRPSVTLAELERSGALRIRARDTTPRTGDVLLKTLGRPPVVATGTVDDEKGVAQVVEIDPDRLDSHFVALFLRADVAALPVSNTHGAISRDDLRRCGIPRIPVAEQRRYGATFRHVLDLQDALSALSKLGRGVLDQTLHGLTTGALLPAPITPRENIATDPNESEI
ncbi:MAG: N-6 DNA methylase [Pseudonocardia sp.]|nr:N-6 DNA methylase [Pseudonocardia sp.]